MPVSAFTRFNVFSEDLCKKIHNLHTDALKIYLTNTLPVVTNSIKADIAEIAGGNGYTAGGHSVTNSASRTGAVTSIIGADVVITASGAVGPFRYVPLYNDTPTSPADPLIGWWDYGSSISLAAGETFTTDFGTSMFTVG